MTADFARLRKSVAQCRPCDAECQKEPRQHNAARGTSFVVNGAAPPRDSTLTTASAEVKWINGVTLAATSEGEFSAVMRSYAGKGVARYQR